MEAARSKALHEAFAAAGLEVPAKPEPEETPSECSAREALEAQAAEAEGLDERERMRLEWSRTQAEARRGLAVARAERAHCQGHGGAAGAEGPHPCPGKDPRPCGIAPSPPITPSQPAPTMMIMMGLSSGNVTRNTIIYVSMSESQSLL